MPEVRGFFAGSRLHHVAPTRLLPQCGVCGLFQRCQSPKMPVAGNGNCSVLFIGEAPGADEDDQGRPFVGKAGKRLRQVLKSLQFVLDDDGWVTNALICRPPKNRKPTSAEVGYCRPNLLAVIKELQPIVIVPLGAVAVSAVIGSLWSEDVGVISRWTGWRIPCQQLNAWVCPTWHPSYLLRENDPVLDRQFEAHLTTAIGLADRPWPVGPLDWAADVQRVLDPVRAAKWLRQAVGCCSGAVAWDYETNMLKPDGPDARIVSCAVAWGRREPERCIAFPWYGEAVTAMGELLRSPMPKIASNLKFEDRWTRKEFGHRVRAWAWDTMLAAHVADNRPSITSVKFQAFVRLGVPLWNDRIEPFLKTRGDETVNRILREIEIEDLLTYNGLDALHEFRVAVDQINELGFAIPWRV
jgi:uracil-DNA glycosylase family 4